jgi:hypothetical protein
MGVLHERHRVPFGKSPNVTNADPDDVRRAKAYFDMEPHINDVVCMGKIAEPSL